MNMLPKIKKIANFSYDHFTKSPGTMLLITGTVGWTLSAAAQVTAVIINDKIPKEQKKFLIPQEIADAAVNIASFFILTKSVTKLGEWLVKSGRLMTPKIKEGLERTKLISRIGTLEDTTTTNGKIKKAEFKIDNQPEVKNKSNPNFDEKLSNSYFGFADGISFVSSTIGSIISCNIVTPILRNKIAANRQKAAIESEKLQKESVLLPNSPVLPAQNKPDSDNRAKLASVNAAPRVMSGGGMKI